MKIYQPGEQAKRASQLLYSHKIEYKRKKSMPISEQYAGHFHSIEFKVSFQVHGLQKRTHTHTHSLISVANHHHYHFQHQNQQSLT